MDYLIPTAWETPEFELGETVTPSPHHPIGAKGVGESATVGSPAAYVNAVVDALAHAGVRNLEMPVTADKVWAALDEVGTGGVTAPRDVLVEAGRLAAERRPYAFATVVRRRAPDLGARAATVRWSSRTASSSAGSAARARSRRSSARRCARSPGRRSRGRRSRSRARCASEGLVEVFIEPQLPEPLLAIVGDEPGRGDPRRSRRPDRLARRAAGRPARRSGRRGDDGPRATRRRSRRRSRRRPGTSGSSRAPARGGNACSRPARAGVGRGSARPGSCPGRPRPRPVDPGGDRGRDPRRARRVAAHALRRPLRGGRAAAAPRRSTPCAGWRSSVEAAIESAEAGRRHATTSAAPAAAVASSLTPPGTRGERK